MDLMEFQGKDLFRAHGIPTTPQGQIATTPEQAEALATEYGVPVMVKAQVLTGGRGKAGGVKYCPDAAAAKAAAEAIPLGRIGTPEDVAAAISYLMSEGGGYMTGGMLDINGGYRMQ